MYQTMVAKKKVTGGGLTPVGTLVVILAAGDFYMDWLAGFFLSFRFLFPPFSIGICQSSRKGRVMQRELKIKPERLK